MRLYGDGMGGSLEEKITIESQMMIERLMESEKKPVDVRLMMGKFIEKDQIICKSEYLTWCKWDTKILELNISKFAYG